MATLTGIDFVAVQVRDMARSRRFYTEQLGLKPAAGGPPHACVFDTAPIPFALREPAVDLEASNRLGWGVALWFACDDADALCRSLEAAGAPILQQPVDGAFGRTFVVADPDGYAITIHGGKQ